MRVDHPNSMLPRRCEHNGAPRASEGERRGDGQSQGPSTGGGQPGQGGQGDGQSGRRRSGNRGRPPGGAQDGGPSSSGPVQRSGRRGRRKRNPEGGAAAAPMTSGPDRTASGYLDLTRHGAGVLRVGALATPGDVTVAAQLVARVGLREGDFVTGIARGQTLQTVTEVNGHSPEGLADRPIFDNLTAIHPDKPFLLGPTPDAITGRLLDLMAPVGRGQRGLIVAPPKAGKTTLLRDMANGLAQNPGVEILVILVGERPEEVTDMRRAVTGTVLASDLDMPGTDHIRVAMLGMEHAKRLAEEGRHVVILMDSLTRLARAVNLNTPGGGRTLSGGMDASALQPVRRFFGAARATEEAGSLTILATCLVDTGSRLDDMVYEEFKGTGNMEVHLDRKLAEKRLFPAINIKRTGTRREELLLEPQTLDQVRNLRRKLASAPDDEALEALLSALRRQPEAGV